MSVAKQLYLQKFKHCGCLTDQVTEGLVMVLVTEWKKFHSEIWFVAYLNITFDCLCKAHYSENNFYITLCRLSIWYASICMQILMIIWRYLVWFLRTPKWWQDNDREAETLSGSVRWGQLPATIKLFVLQKMTRVNSVKLNICTSIVTFVQCLISVLFIYLSMYFFFYCCLTLNSLLDRTLPLKVIKCHKIQHHFKLLFMSKLCMCVSACLWIVMGIYNSSLSAWVKLILAYCCQLEICARRVQLAVGTSGCCFGQAGITAAGGWLWCSVSHTAEGWNHSQKCSLNSWIILFLSTQWAIVWS